MKKWWIYIGKNNEGTVDTKYVATELIPLPDHLIFVGTCEVYPEFFDPERKNRFIEHFDNYGEKYYEKKIKKIFNLI